MDEFIKQFAKASGLSEDVVRRAAGGDQQCLVQVRKAHNGKFIKYR